MLMFVFKVLSSVFRDVFVRGGVAQLGERLPCTQEVIGSIPFTSTINCKSVVVDLR